MPEERSYIEQQDLFTSGEGGYVRYRIPALAVTTRGTVLAFCEARKFTGRDSDQIDLFLRRSFNGGRTFDRVTMPRGDRDLGLITLRAGGTATVAWTLTAVSPCAAVPMREWDVEITEMNGDTIFGKTNDPAARQVAVPHMPYGTHNVTISGQTGIVHCRVSETREVIGRDNNWAPFSL